MLITSFLQKIECISTQMSLYENVCVIFYEREGGIQGWNNMLRKLSLILWKYYKTSQKTIRQDAKASSLIKIHDLIWKDSKLLKKITICTRFIKSLIRLKTLTTYRTHKPLSSNHTFSKESNTFISKHHPQHPPIFFRALVIGPWLKFILM